MKSTEYGLQITVSELRRILERAEMEIAHNSGEGYLYFREDEIEQPCVYRECSSTYYR